MTETELRSIKRSLVSKKSRALRMLRKTKSTAYKNRYWGRVLGLTNAMRLLGIQTPFVDINGSEIPDSKVLFGINRK